MRRTLFNRGTNMKHQIANLVLLAGSILTMNAMADNRLSEETDNPYLQNGRAYVGGMIGYASIDPGPTVSSVTGGIGWNINTGYLWHKERFAYGPELSYNNFSSVAYSGNKLAGSSVNAMAVGQVSINEKWNAVAKLGLAIVTQNFNATVSTRVMPATYLGAAYVVDEHLAVNGGYQYVSGTTPMYALLGGVTYTF
jgi:hypothetical protein